MGFALLLAACASAPKQINDICAVFDQRDSWLNNWQSISERAERKYGIPVAILMATVRKESGFKSDARPPRTYYLGFIPGKRASSAYGYSQALDGTWDQYRIETLNLSARRGNFDDAVDFIGWYHSKTAEKYGVAKNDAYNLYLAYYLGWTGYGRGDHQSNATLRKYARDTANMAVKYDQQLRSCR